MLGEGDDITVNMGVPEFEPSKIPFRAKQMEKTYIMRVEDQTLFCGVVSMGNPHVVTVVDDIDTAAWKHWVHYWSLMSVSLSESMPVSCKWLAVMK